MNDKLFGQKPECRTSTNYHVATQTNVDRLRQELGFQLVDSIRTIPTSSSGRSESPIIPHTLGRHRPDATKPHFCRVLDESNNGPRYFKPPKSLRFRGLRFPPIRSLSSENPLTVRCRSRPLRAPCALVTTMPVPLGGNVGRGDSRAACTTESVVSRLSIQSVLLRNLDVARHPRRLLSSSLATPSAQVCS